jgi:hypothetical protein
MMSDDALGFGFTFHDLAEREGLIRLDQTFLKRLEEADPELHVRLLTARATPESMHGKDESTLIIDVAAHLDAFVAELFGIGLETSALTAETLALEPVHECKRLFVQRQAVRKYPDPRVSMGRRYARGLSSGLNNR